MSSSPMWRRDKNKIDPRTGQPIRFPLAPDADMTALPQLVFPPRPLPVSLDDDGGTDEWETFKIMLIFEDDTVETITVTAMDQDDALNHALKIRQTPHHIKVKTSVVHDGLGEVIGELVHGIDRGYTMGKAVIGRAGRIGARVVGDIGHAGAEIAGGIGLGAGRTVASFRRVKSEYQIGRLERLLADAASDNPTRRAVARREIQQVYPTIYRHIGWQRV